MTHEELVQPQAVKPEILEQVRKLCRNVSASQLDRHEVRRVIGSLTPAQVVWIENESDSDKTLNDITYLVWSCSDDWGFACYWTHLYSLPEAERDDEPIRRDLLDPYSPLEPARSFAQETPLLWLFEAVTRNDMEAKPVMEWD